MKALGSLFKSIKGGSALQKPSLFSGVPSNYFKMSFREVSCAERKYSKHTSHIIIKT